jgi:excisionase family DNA binding protein
MTRKLEVERLAEAAQAETGGASHAAEGELATLEPLALRAKDAARLLGISTRTLWNLTKEGEIPHLRLRRAVTYPVAELRAWVKRRAKGGK